MLTPEQADVARMTYAERMKAIEDIAAGTAILAGLSHPQRALAQAIALLAKHKPYKIYGTEAASLDIEEIIDDVERVARPLDKYVASWGTELSTVFVSNIEDSDAVNLRMDKFEAVVTKGLSDLIDYLEVLSDSIATFTGRMSIRAHNPFARGWGRTQ